MRYRTLGTSGLRVSSLCLGTMTFDPAAGWGTDDRDSKRVLQAFLDRGGNFVDTHTYGPAEDVLGELLAGDRDRVVLATKFGGTLDPDDVNASGAHRKSMVRSVESSLRRLRTDYIDLLWLHAWDALTPTAELMRAVDDLVRAGKVLYVGVANAPGWAVAHANVLAEWRGWTPFCAVQAEYSLVERDVDRDILPMVSALGLGLAAWTPLASGWLSGKYQGDGGADRPADRIRRLDDPIMTRFLPRNERTVAIAAEVTAIARETGTTPSQVALNWVRARGAIPVFGATSPEQVEDNMGCTDSDLSPEHMSRLAAVSDLPLGFPQAFLSSGLVRRLMYGAHLGELEG